MRGEGSARWSRGEVKGKGEGGGVFVDNCRRGEREGLKVVFCYEGRRGGHGAVTGNVDLQKNVWMRIGGHATIERETGFTIRV